MQAEMKTAKATAVRGREAWTWVVACCPYCGREHRHGGGSRERPALPAHRVAHCNTGELRSYTLVEEI